tara:strand:+ start:1336 stop:1656 length:321 start_codon:yes stop_codon:yes gene_type:complete
MSDKQYDSVLVGYCEEPRYYEDNLSSWSVKLKASELQEMIDKYTTTVNEQGQGGNVYLKLFFSKSGKPCCSVFDPNSAAAQAKRAAKAQEAKVTPAPVAAGDDLPF